MRLDATDHLVMSYLTWRVRVSAQHLLEEFTSHTGIGRRIHKLRRYGLVHVQQLPVVELTPNWPFVIWEDFEQAPNLAELAWLLSKRADRSKTRVVELVWATAWAQRLFGGVAGKLRQRLQIDHDLGIAAVFVRRQRLPLPQAEWIGEDAYRTYYAGELGGRKVPDVLLRNTDGRFFRAVEFGGRYQAARLQAFHHFCQRERLSYEIW